MVAGREVDAARQVREAAVAVARARGCAPRAPPVGRRPRWWEESMSSSGDPRSPRIRTSRRCGAAEPSAPPRPRRPWLPRLTAVVAGRSAAWRVAYARARARPLPAARGDAGRGARVTTGDGSVAHGRVRRRPPGGSRPTPTPSPCGPWWGASSSARRARRRTPSRRTRRSSPSLRNLDIENALGGGRGAVALREADMRRRGPRSPWPAPCSSRSLALRAESRSAPGDLAVARTAAERSAGPAASRREASARGRAQSIARAQEDLVDAGEATPVGAQDRPGALQEAGAAREGAARRRRRAPGGPGACRGPAGACPGGRRRPARPAGSAWTRRRGRSARAAAAVALARRRLSPSQSAMQTISRSAPRMDGVVLRLESAPGALVGPEGEFKGEGEGYGLDRSAQPPDGRRSSRSTTRRTCRSASTCRTRTWPASSRVPRSSIEAKALPGRTFQGRGATACVHEADITKAKLQVKVRHRGSRSAAASGDAVHGALPREGRGRGRRDGRARRRAPRSPPRPCGATPSSSSTPPAVAARGAFAVRVVRQDGDWTEVEGDLGLSSKVILDDVEDGQSVRGE